MGGLFQFQRLHTTCHTHIDEGNELLWRIDCGRCWAALFLLNALAVFAVQAPQGTELAASAAGQERSIHPLRAARVGLAPSPDMQLLLQWLQRTGDQRGAPFVVIDKRWAQLWVVGADLQPLATSPVLLGAAVGDESVPGIGERPLSGDVPRRAVSRQPGQVEIHMLSAALPTSESGQYR